MDRLYPEDGPSWRLRDSDQIAINGKRLSLYSAIYCIFQINDYFLGISLCLNRCDEYRYSQRNGFICICGVHYDLSNDLKIYYRIRIVRSNFFSFFFLFGHLVNDIFQRGRILYRIISGHFPIGCQSEVRWMFGHLDNDGDDRLSLSELYGLEHDQNEPCLKPFLDACDTDR